MTSRRVLLRRALPVGVLAALAACGGNVVVDSASGGATGTGAGLTTGTLPPSTSSSTGFPMSSSSSSSSGVTSSGSSSGQVCPSMTVSQGACTPGAACSAASSPCLAAVPQNGADQFSLRMSHVAFTKPAAFTEGIVQNILGGAITPNAPACNLNGTGTFNWLLQYDTANSQVTVGGATPTPSFGGPYSFLNQVLPTLGGGSINVTPVVFKAPSSSMCAIDAQSGGQEVVLPIFLDNSGTSAMYLPLQDLQLMKGFFSADHSCIGTFNGGGLSPANGCNADSTHPAFIDGGYLSAYIVLAEADGVAISAINESLCVLLSQNTAMYGQMGPDGITVCAKGTTGQILFQGDWCSTTNGPATSTCADSVQVFGSFSASGVTIQ